MIPSLSPCFTPRVPEPPPPDRTPRPSHWVPGTCVRHASLTNVRSGPVVRHRMGRIEPVAPDLPPPMPMHEIARSLVAHFNDCLTDPSRLGMLAQVQVQELRAALPLMHELSRHWLRWCNQARIGDDNPEVAATADKLLRAMTRQLAVVRDQSSALPGFATRMGELEALGRSIQEFRTLMRDMPDYVRSVRPSDGSWDRTPPTVAEVLLLMKGPRQDPKLVSARLEDGQRPGDIASQPSDVQQHQLELLRHQLAEQLGNADLALPLTELQILLAPPPVPLDCITLGLRHGLDATETRAMYQAGVPIHPDTVPDAALRQRLTRLRPMAPQRLGQGQVNVLELRSWTDGTQVETWAWRPEVPDAFANAMIDCGIARRDAQDWHLPGPHLTGRQVLTSRLARRLGLDRHLTVVASHTAVIDGVYGSLNQYLPGLQKLLTTGAQRIPLTDAERHWLGQHPDGPNLVADIARWQGLSGLVFAPEGLMASASVPQLGGTTVDLPMVLPLPIEQAGLRRQMVAAVWLHLLTGQVDWNAGNVAFVPDPQDPEAGRLVLFDNDLAFGHAMLHPEDACNNQRSQATGPRVHAPASNLHGTRFPRVMPADLAASLLTLDQAGLLACGAAGHLNRLEHAALRSRLHHMQQQVRLLQTDPHGLLHTDADWLSAETTARLGLDHLQEQADAVASAVLVPPGQKVDASLLRELESDSLLRALAVYQRVAQQHPEQQWFPVLFNPSAIQQAVRTAMQQAGAIPAPVPTPVTVPTDTNDTTDHLHP